MRIRSVLPAAAILAAAALSPAAAPASAACTVTADLPARVVVDRPDQDIPVPLRGCEGYLGYASGSLRNSQETVGLLLYSGSRLDYWNLSHYAIPGQYRTIDGYAADQDGNRLGWADDYTSVRFGTRAGFVAARSGPTVALTAALSRYARDDGWVPYTGVVVGFQHCLSATSGCTTIGYAKTGSGGRASFTAHDAAARYYRVFYSDTGSFWGATTARQRR